MPRMIDRRAMLATGAGAAAALALNPACAASAKRPNILFIMADDLGYADLSCYGREDYATPAIDGLAKQGMRFTSAYANSPVCSATRTALITGRYQYRLPVGLEEPLSTRPLGLPPEHPTLPSLLRKAGYGTALIGKWHLGLLPDYGPLKSGYDHFFGFRAGGVDYFTHSFGKKHDLWDGDTRAEETGYLTDLLADRTIGVIEHYAKNDRPFFVSLHFSAPHWPWEGPEDRAVADRLAKEPNGLKGMLNFDGGTMKTYAEMVTRMDQGIARVLASLKRLGLDRDTIVVFTSDNGGERFSKTWPFSGRKSELLEGGVRVPCIVRWPGVAKPGSVSDVPVMSMDWLPTFITAAGAATHPAFPSDGRDIAAQIAGAPMADRALFWRYKYFAQEAHRQGAWKYLKIGENRFLFNVIEDPMERANLMQREPERFRRMTAAYDAWNATMLPLDPKSDSHGWSGDTSADRYGIPTSPRP